MVRKIAAMKARQRLGAILDKVKNADDRYIIERDGEPMAIVISLKAYESMENLKAARSEDARRCLGELLDRQARRNKDWTQQEQEEFEEEIELAIGEVRRDSVTR